MSAVAKRSLGPELVLTQELGPDTQVLIIGVVGAQGRPEVLRQDASGHILPARLCDVLVEKLVAVGARGTLDEVTRIPAPEGLAHVTSVLAIGLGSQEDIDEERIRRASGVAARALAGVRVAATTLAPFGVGAVAEGSFLGGYRFTEFRSEKTAPKPEELPVGRIELLVPTTDFGEEEFSRAKSVAEAVALARDFVNTPPSHLYPAAFAERIREVATEAGLEVDILDEQELVAGGYGGLVGVGKGSARGPRLVRVTYSGGPTEVALVGKGITFDTGGISIKPAANMENMTSDMAGAAAVVATVVAAARSRLPITVTAWAALAENMPSGTAQRPGDVLTQYGGRTVEVINTDAEGRLVLADALVRAGQDEPEYLLDVATLTGAQIVALGTRTPGIMGTPEFRDRVARISQDVGENGWAMPLPEELRADLNSSLADIANASKSRNGGMLVAGHYLKEFVPEGVHWAHLDVAGPAYNTGNVFGYIGKGGTGVPVRTLLAVLESIGENPGE